MTGRIAKRLAELGIDLPPPGIPRGTYVPFTVSGNVVFVSGQGPRIAGELKYAGKVGAERTIEEGYKAAEICALNLLSHLRVACDGDLDRVVKTLRVAGLVHCTPDFADHAQVINGASDLLHSVLGANGLHARIATGTSSLPSQMTVEVEACFEVRMT